MSHSPARSRSREPARYSPSRGSYSRSPSLDRRGRSYTPDRNDDQVTTVYVGGISFDTDERALQNYFQKFGTVLETKVVIDRETQRSKGYGFVKFEDPRDAKDAISGCNGKLLDGRTVRCNMAKYNPGSGPPPGPRGGYTEGYGGRGPPDFGGGRGYGGRGYGGRGGYDDGYHGGRGRGGGRYENGGGRGGGRFGYGGRGGPPPVPYPGEGQAERGPPSKRQRSVSASPPREGRHKHRRSRRKKYSTSPSGSSYSRSASRSESRSPKHHKSRTAAPAAAAAAAPDEATVAELEAARKRVAELESRVAALEAQAAAQGTARGALTDQLADLTTAQQKAEATHKLYRRWMSALLESAQEMLEGKEQVAAAEAQLAERQRNLATMVTEADGFLAQERRSRKAARRSDVSAEPNAVDAVATLAPAVPTANGVAPLPPDDAPGGWQDAGTPAAAAVEAPNPAGARLAGTKFTIET